MPTYLNDRIPFAPGTPLEVVACVGTNELSGIQIHSTTYLPEGGKFSSITLGYEEGFAPFDNPVAGRVLLFFTVDVTHDLTEQGKVFAVAESGAFGHVDPRLLLLDNNIKVYEDLDEFSDMVEIWSMRGWRLIPHTAEEMTKWIAERTPKTEADTENLHYDSISWRFHIGPHCGWCGHPNPAVAEKCEACEAENCMEWESMAFFQHL